MTHVFGFRSACAYVPFRAFVTTAVSVGYLMGRIVTAADIVAKLGGGRWGRHSGNCRCPAHKDDTPSLAVSETRDKRILVHCHAGCDQRAVLDALRAMGLWGKDATIDPSHPYFATTKSDGMGSYADRERRLRASEDWERALPARGTRLEAYLRARGIRLAMSDQIRYAPSCKHREEGKSFPAMIGRLADNKQICSIQRTFLDPIEPRKAQLSDRSFAVKKSLGPMGAAAIRLKMPAGDQLGLAEGIETALSANQLYMVPTWATCSANRLGKIEIPDNIRSIVIFGDSGAVGRREAFAAADIYEKRGLQVEIVFPAADFGGQFDDFNSALQDRQ